MTTATQLTNSSAPLMINGKEFQATLLNDKDYAYIDEYIQGKIIEVAKKNLMDLSPPERMELLQAAIKAAAGTGWATIEGNKIMSTVDGIYHLGWLMIRKNHPRITFEQFNEMADKDRSEALENINITFLKLTGLFDDKETEPSEDVKSGSEGTDPV